MPVLAKAIQITAGKKHACALLDGGQIKCWGNNALGQLGLGHKSSIGDQDGEMGINLAAVDLGYGRTAIRVVAAADVSCAILDNNDLKCWGYNQFGQLGQGHKRILGDEEGEMGDSLPPIDLGRDTYVADVTIGESFVCALTNIGRVKCWGANRAGQLGHGSAGGDEPGGIKNKPEFVKFPNDARVIQIASGVDYTCALLQGGNVRCWGGNERGQLGQEHTRNMEELNFRPRNVSLGKYQVALAISAGDMHTCAVLEEDREIMCWGGDDSGELGMEASVERPLSIGDEKNEMGDDLIPLRLGKYAVIDQIVAGPERTCAFIDGDSIKCWGANGHGQLGLGHTRDIPNKKNKKRNIVNTIEELEPIDFGSEARVKQLALGGSFTCALQESGDVRCWGSNDRGELGRGNDKTYGDTRNHADIGRMSPIDFGLQ